MGVRAIDVSRYQGTIDWRAVAASGVRGAWIKVGGADAGLYLDPRAATNIAGADTAGIPYGTYYFCDTRRGAVECARHAFACGHGHGTLWPVADLETNAGGQDLDIWLNTFCAEIRRLTGRDSIWYGNVGVGVGYTPQAPSCPLWIANYGRNVPGTTPPGFEPAVPPAWTETGWSVWQYNSVTRVPGIPDNTTDQNVITDAFWAHMTGSSIDVKEYSMRAIGLPAHTGGAEWVITTDGNGHPRRTLIESPEHRQGYVAADLIADAPTVQFTGPVGDAIAGIPEANQTTADWTAVELMVETVKRVTDVLPGIVAAALAAVTGPELPAGFAEDVAARVDALLAARLAD